MAAGNRDLGRSLLPSPRTRSAIAKRLASTTGAMTTAAVAEMERRHRWFSELDAEHRSWISLVAQGGIDGFVTWFRDPESVGPSAAVFGRAPRELARRVTLQQTVELVRTTIDVVESQISQLMPRADRAVLQVAVWHYSREVAFAAAEVYARAAEMRGSWDTRLEALVVDAIIRGETDETVLSRASTLGWDSASAALVVVGPAPEAQSGSVVDEVRRRMSASHVDVLGAVQGDRLIILLGGPDLSGPDPIALVDQVVDLFGPGPVVAGPVVDHLAEATASTRSALSGFRAAPAWPAVPRPVAAHDLLPERALAGDGHARHALVSDVYDPLESAGSGLLETVITFFEENASVEAASRTLFVHANTVRYRLRRVHEVTGYSPTDSRDAYALRMAITLGRLQRRSSTTDRTT
ncbi:PucR family transcriptional regulator [Propionibacteriaceae bacterium Y2011]|uniref:PucR family transcriptional regulator n=1 Tax=Microlunatus sp. Y2014 TaxID=3418488 RepID=UPI003B43E9E2